MARLIVSLAGVLLVVGCTGGTRASPRLNASPTLTEATTQPTPVLATETPLMAFDIPQSVLDPILEEASNLSSLPVSDLTVLSAEAVTWSDGSLGCPEPGMMYTQALVDGYQVVIRAGATTYAFHGTGNNFRLCPAATRGPKPTIEIPPPPIQEPADRY